MFLLHKSILETNILFYGGGVFPMHFKLRKVRPKLIFLHEKVIIYVLNNLFNKFLLIIQN